MFDFNGLYRFGFARGLYDYPVYHPVPGIVAPSADAVARALAGRGAIRLQPSGAYAANVLGISGQVPLPVTAEDSAAIRRDLRHAPAWILGKVEPSEPAERFNLRGECLTGCGKVFDLWSVAKSRQRGDAAERKRAKSLRGGGKWPIGCVFFLPLEAHRAQSLLSKWDERVQLWSYPESNPLVVTSLIGAPRAA